VVALLDVNVLIALVDPIHIYHEAAHHWFALNRGNGWATCALTENGLVCVLSNPSYQGNRSTLKQATSSLHALCDNRAREHLFWTESLSVRDSGLFNWNRVQGHRQLSDVYLLALAVSRHGRFTSFDTAISLEAVYGATTENLEILAA
jgi:toxin-antitoxin system PIN domain toxin